ncbi:hypothetical protein LTR91_011736 [Friedmanniomyces endolithicus]|uniref:G-patch domain-containing protein n=1 Tax=Friedmanniomyces endolithicus TaxID=329885 RepID=A0AAN6QRE5_9PEZI|nr:hypothetical protein LTS09_009009 [Friedmanniomyces endolithicus]KAK0337897.1 hypothetical protein LTR94_002495 [Friedmanniomyces endolithicus]KAK0801370.1 hypothetical protein LTR59_005403 [Friedmanniomyces endolithicus]KAK0851784.1 hypothetical protein LTR03_003808 [Friedmanniomyces endolithicus]KAK0869316.1 hypothetical protein LTS02_003084 [Friedmanniomyces endolithicus]
MAAPTKKMGLSLYANLLEPDKQPGATISGAPVRYDMKKAGADDADAQKRKDAALQFQPVRRPQAQAKINRPAKKAGNGHMPSSSTTTASLAPSASSPDKQTPITSTPSQQPSVQRSNFADWVGDEDEDYFVDDKPKPERGGRNKKKKKGGKLQQEATRSWSWDDIYDPSMPNNYADYKGSDEQIMEIRDWKARLYYHQLKSAKTSGAPRGEAIEKKPAMNSKRNDRGSASQSNSIILGMFAPPSILSFAPPSFDGPLSRPDDNDEYHPPSAPIRLPDISDDYEPPQTMSSTVVADEPRSKEVDPRRMPLNRDGASQKPMVTPAMVHAPPPLYPAVVPSAAMSDSVAAAIAAKKAEAAAKVAAFKAKVEAHKAAKAAIVTETASSAPSVETATVPTLASQPAASERPQTQPSPPPPAPIEDPEPSAIISRAPVRYQLPPHVDDVIGEDAAMTEPAEDAVRSNRPGQKGFAERLLKKYGWEKGKGLGVQGNEGITTAIVAKAEKRKKLADAEGGGWAKPANMGKLVGGKRRKVEGSDVVVGDGEDGGRSEDQPYGPLSPVIKLSNMLTGLDIDDEVENKDLYGEVGREMETQYGKVERVFIWRQAMGGGDEVFVKFVSPLSALRAVGASDGMEFAENVVSARFWEGERFEAGEYA